jgi:hypothetical protein
VPSPDWVPSPNSPPTGPDSLPSPDSPPTGPAAPNALPVGPGGLPVGPVKMLGMPAGVDSLTAGPNDLPAGPDEPVPARSVLVGVMSKLLTLPVDLLPVPVPPPVNVLAAPNCVVVVVVWRVIVVADSRIGATPSGAAADDAEKALPGVFGPSPWCVFASAVPVAANPMYIVAAVTTPVITIARVHDHCSMLCLPTMMPLCNKMS